MDLASKHPLADVAAWLGHTRTVAARHYLRPTEASFAAVTGRTGGDCGEIRGDARGDNSADLVVTPVVTLSAALDRLALPDATQVPSPPQLISIQRVLERAGADLCELPENLASGPDRSTTTWGMPRRKQGKWCRGGDAGGDNSAGPDSGPWIGALGGRMVHTSARGACQDPRPFGCGRQ
jgi:hypothetical protein